MTPVGHPFITHPARRFAPITVRQELERVFPEQRSESARLGRRLSPFPEDSLPDGGSGGSARVVPDHFGTDWTAEIGNRDVRMKAEHVKTTATTEAVSSHPGENGHWSQKWRRNTSRSAEKPMADWKKDLQIYEAGRK